MNKVVQDTEVKSLLLSVSDIRDCFFEGASLSESERTAMQNFDAFRIEYLKQSESSADFDQRYFLLQLLENLYPYTHFLIYDKINTSI
ncbi:MAG: hypothetical protein WDZ35_10415 [Crocinitomicaceae bacterium]